MTSMIAPIPKNRGLLPPHVDGEEFDGLEFEEIAHRIDPEYWQYYPVHPEYLTKTDIPDAAKKVFRDLLAQLVKEILDEEASDLKRYEATLKN